MPCTRKLEGKSGKKQGKETQKGQMPKRQPFGEKEGRAKDYLCRRNALVRSLARVVYRMLKYKVEYETISVEEYEAKYKEQQIQYMKKKAAKLGFELVPA